jgi:hypothetical protein
MPSDKLVKADEHPLVQRLDPQVETKAQPQRDWLLQARADINSDTDLQQIFREARAEGRSPESVADAVSSYLTAKWGGHGSEAYEAALYLANEHDQLGEGVHLVSTETGRVTLTLAEKDIWQPPDVPREGGGMVKPLPRIRPDLESLVVTWTFDQVREQHIVQALAARGHQTDLLRQEGDPRLLVATRAGRRQIVQGIVGHTPKALLEATGGTAAAFLRHLDLRTTEPVGTALQALSGVVTARSKMTIADQTTVNLHHNRARTLQGALAQGWVRDIARRLSLAVQARSSAVGEIDAHELRAEHLGDVAWFWVAPPELVSVIQELRPNCTILPSDGAALIGFLKPKVGALVVPEEFAAEHHERFDQWEVATHLPYQLWVDWDAFKYLPVGGLEYQGYVVGT